MGMHKQNLVAWEGISYLSTLVLLAHNQLPNALVNASMPHVIQFILWIIIINPTLYVKKIGLESLKKYPEPQIKIVVEQVLKSRRHFSYHSLILSSIQRKQRFTTSSPCKVAAKALGDKRAR